MTQALSIAALGIVGLWFVVSLLWLPWIERWIDQWEWRQVEKRARRLNAKEPR